MPKPLHLAVAAALALGVAVFAVTQLSEPDLIPVTSTAGLTLAGPITVEPGTPTAGQTVTVRATISADKTVVLPQVTIQVRDESGVSHDFPTLADVEVGPMAREFVLERQFAKPGSYTYFLAYRTSGDWVGLPPWQTMRVRQP
ncbi:hypothetical protein [Actinokineospora sp. HUAS TT18]|uniref:hypothetical protein n=1 Tax=Actinokineospora sp. HUAS TT18 TaxID=3447451 RepID=UPI003F51F627